MESDIIVLVCFAFELTDSCVWLWIFVNDVENVKSKMDSQYRVIHYVLE